jgi:5-methylcytosine-specific restriction endonuclease McrA
MFQKCDILIGDKSSINREKIMLTYKGYAVNTVKEAVERYTEKTGFEPTVLLVRPEHEITGKHPGLIRSSKYGLSGIVLVSHLLGQDEIDNLRLSVPDNLIRLPGAGKSDLATADLAAKSPRVYVRTQKDGRPKHGDGTCPHCKQKIKEFEALGWWWGWSQGIEPEYWEELRFFVFQRDKFTCTKCHNRFGMNGLQCHHVTPKEEGGADSSRNLITLCSECHEDAHPIYPEQEGDK